MEYQTIQVVPVSEVLSLIETNQSNENISPEVMTIGQLSEFLGVSQPTIRKRIKQGLPVSEKLGDKRFIKADVLEWLRE